VGTLWEGKQGAQRLALAAPLSQTPPTGKMAAGLFLVIETRKPRRSGA
jgi:hypothetical protein